MTLRLSGLFSIFNLVFSVPKSLLGIGQLHDDNIYKLKDSGSCSKMTSSCNCPIVRQWSLQFCPESLGVMIEVKIYRTWTI